MMPSVARSVHYIESGGSACRAAIVTEASPQTETVTLIVLTPSAGTYPMHGVAHDETKKSGTWHWPERVEE